MSTKTDKTEQTGGQAVPTPDEDAEGRDRPYLLRQELQVLAANFERVTISLMESIAGAGGLAALRQAELGARLEFCERLQGLRLTTSGIDWAAVRQANEAR